VAPGPQHRSPSAGGHPVPESVALGPLAGVWLEGALHLGLLVVTPAGSRIVTCRCAFSGVRSHLRGARTTRRSCRAGAHRRGREGQEAIWPPWKPPLSRLWTGCYGAPANRERS
jgi:hypothetical protein